MTLYGLLNLSFWGYVVAILILTQLTVASITIYLHRCQAHRALDLHPAVAHFFRFWLWLTTGMTTRNWVSIHRKHHAKCETMEDPHSPVILGIRKVFFEGAELYRQAGKNKETIERYSEGTPNDWMENKFYAPGHRYGIALMFLIDLVLFGVPGITVWAVQMLWTPVFAAGVINGIGHYWGYRNFECADASRNIVPWTFFACGEELHNNHHTFPTSAKLSVKPWEFDIGWLYIRILKMFGLAKVKRLPAVLRYEKGKSVIDINTLTAIVANRLQVISDYSHEVIMPVLREELRKADKTRRALLDPIKETLIRADNLIDEMGKQRLMQALEKCQTLQLVYNYRVKLQAIWSRTTASQRELLEAFQIWCKEAEETGVSTLREFAQRLKGYYAVSST